MGCINSVPFLSLIFFCSDSILRSWHAVHSSSELNLRTIKYLYCFCILWLVNVLKFEIIIKVLKLPISRRIIVTRWSPEMSWWRLFLLHFPRQENTTLRRHSFVFLDYLWSTFLCWIRSGIQWHEQKVKPIAITRLFQSLIVLLAVWICARLCSMWKVQFYPITLYILGTLVRV